MEDFGPTLLVKCSHGDSGKKLTSFKAATLLKENEHIQKCVFVVVCKELNSFQEGFVKKNTNTDTECFRTFFSEKEIWLPS